MNIGEIARRAGVSRSTVSYTLSGKRAVSDETRRRIQAVIDELDYRPNAAARALKEGRTRTLGLVIPPASLRLTDVQLGFVASVVEAAARVDLDVLLSPSGGDHDRSFERIVTGRRVDGVILMEIRLQDERPGSPTGLPFVTIGHTAPRGTCGRRRLRDLIARCVHHLPTSPPRHRRSTGPPNWWPRATGRHSARRAAAEGAASAADRRRPRCADYPAAGEACLEQLRDEHPDVTGIVTINEATLPGLQRAIERARIAVPADLSITGVVARHWAEDFRPPLTAADVPTEMGTQAVELLLERIATPEPPPRHLLLTPPISLRASTGPAPRR
jgi:DNA-binding LacI/PurR family transcriptional regulator